VRKKLVAVGVSLGLVMGVVGATSASALSLYEHDNYRGSVYSAWPSNYVGNAMNDRASSARSWGDAPTYWEDRDKNGRWLSVRGNIARFGHYRLNAWENWNDRISSFGYR